MNDNLIFYVKIVYLLFCVSSLIQSWENLSIAFKVKKYFPRLSTIAWVIGVLQFGSAAVGLFLVPGETPLCILLIGILLLLQFSIVVILDAPFNGGCDYMSFNTAFVLLLSLSAPEWARYALGYLGVQVVFSYFLAGLSKSRQKSWWTGVALESFFVNSSYSVPRFIQNFFVNKSRLRVLSILILLFELFFPLALLHVNLSLFFISLALLFQLSIFYVFGLNRFLLAWSCAYPALYFLSSR